MKVFTIILATLLSLFSTAVMSFVAMATPIGPWIAPTLALIALLMTNALKSFLKDKEQDAHHVALATASGSIGGILATGLGFSFPAIAFLDHELFNEWLAKPYYFSFVVSSLSFASGVFGLFIANLFEKTLITEQQLPFPVGQLVHKMIDTQNQLRKAYELIIGFLGALLTSMLQDGVTFCKTWIPHCFTVGILPKSVAIIEKISVLGISLPAITLQISPLFWAVGFVTGHVIALPLTFGVISKSLLAEPLNHHLFPTLSPENFMLAFASGMIVASAFSGFIETPKALWKSITTLGSAPKKDSSWLATFLRVETVVVSLILLSFLTYFQFPITAQIYTVLFAGICAYQMAIIGGKMGIAPLGRFATFVMVPAMFIFKLSFMQLILIATFIEICGGVAVDILFGRKMAQLANIPRKKIMGYQLFGIAISALSVGFIFWLLIKQFTLGSPDLAAQKAIQRALLINSGSFDYYVLALGALFGYFLKVININPAFVLTGLLMPLTLSIGLIIGGLFTLLTKDREAWYPFWSGIFAANSVWMLLKTLG